MTHYETLKIENTASADDIKRAYYKLVRQFPPERFPDEFRAVREAYNILSDKELRTKYDSELKKHNESSENLTTDEIGQIESARIEIQRAHTGAAVKIAEKLYERRPDNAAVISLLADAYTARGWNRKAYDLIISRAYHKTLKTSYDWEKYSAQLKSLGFSESAIFAETIQGIYELSKTGGDDLVMCAWAYFLFSKFEEILSELNLPETFNTGGKLLKHILKLSKNGLKPDDVDSFASNLIGHVAEHKMPSELNGEDIEKLEIIIEIIKITGSEHILKKSKIGDLITSIEYLLEEINEPAQKLEPIRVGTKIGRNDPCPCGSGKKYKKCCGR